MILLAGRPFRGPPSCRMYVLKVLAVGIKVLQDHLYPSQQCTFTAFALSVSRPLSLALPAVPSLLAVVIFTMWLTFPGFIMAHFTQTTKYELSLVRKLAFEWLLQNLSVLAMRFSQRY